MTGKKYSDDLALYRQGWRMLSPELKAKHLAAFRNTYRKINKWVFHWRRTINDEDEFAAYSAYVIMSIAMMGDEAKKVFDAPDNESGGE